MPHLQHAEPSSSEATPLNTDSSALVIDQSVDSADSSREAAVNSISLALQQTIERAKVSIVLTGLMSCAHTNADHDSTLKWVFYRVSGVMEKAWKTGRRRFLALKKLRNLRKCRNQGKFMKFENQSWNSDFWYCYSKAILACCVCIPIRFNKNPGNIMEKTWNFMRFGWKLLLLATIYSCTRWCTP